MDWFLYDRSLRHERVNMDPAMKGLQALIGLESVSKKVYTVLIMILTFRIKPISCHWFLPIPSKTSENLWFSNVFREV